MDLDRIEVDDRVNRFVGDKNVLEQAVNGRVVSGQFSE